MMGVLSELNLWATTLRFWEQAALEKIISGVELADEDYEELLQYLLEDAGLREPAGQRPTLHFHKGIDADTSPTKPVRLVSISNLQNINALVSGQTLTFGPQMTAIYGGNGSGKSGYARVLGCAGFSRGDRDVLPDVTSPIDDTAVLSADIEVGCGNERRVIHCEIGNECRELRSCYVFDSASVRVHLTESNELSFCPAGLSRLTRLVEVTDEVRKRLKILVDESSKPHSFDTLFQGKSEVRDRIVDLGPNTNLEELRQMASLAPEESKQIGELDTQIARLKSETPAKHVKDLGRRVRDLELLTEQLRGMETQLDDSAVEDIRRAVKRYLKRQAAARHLGVDQFRSEHFTQTGSDIWYRFIEAAKVLADAEQTPGEPYPQADSYCLLCRQPLSSQARDLLCRLWKFLEGEAQDQLEKAQSAMEEKRLALDELCLDFFDDQSVSYRHLQECDPTTMDRVKEFITACCRRRDQVLEITHACSEEFTGIEISPLPESPIRDIERVIGSLKEKLDELVKKDSAGEIERLEQKKQNLQHRELLGEHLREIEEYVKRRIWGHRAEKAGGSTAHITRKYNQLFDQLVTNRYVKLFEQMLSDFGWPTRVRVETKGRKGGVFKQIVVASHSSCEDIAKPDKVLSEGEKRAVALADFMAEVALDATSSAVVLDDPVTSLDLEWRERVASTLAEGAKRRQIIVFTHDLPFLYFLKRCCESKSVQITTHWIKRGDNDSRPGYVFLDNTPALERDYRKPTRARAFYEKAKSASAEQQEVLLRDGFGALRSTYEAFIVFDLFNEVVMRFDERISFGRLRDVVYDRQIADDVIAACERLSRYIEGHLHSDALGATKPTLRTLLDEIEMFEKIRKRLNNLKKSQEGPFEGEKAGSGLVSVKGKMRKLSIGS